LTLLGFAAHSANLWGCPWTGDRSLLAECEDQGGAKFDPWAEPDFFGHFAAIDTQGRGLEPRQFRFSNSFVQAQAFEADLSTLIPEDGDCQWVEFELALYGGEPNRRRHRLKYPQRYQTRSACAHHQSKDGVADTIEIWPQRRGPVTSDSAVITSQGPHRIQPSAGQVILNNSCRDQPENQSY